MKLNALKTVFLATCGWLALQASSHAGTERQFPEWNIALTQPDSWVDQTKSVPQKGLVVAYSDPAKMRLVYVVTTDENPPTSEANDHFAAEVEKGVVKSGGGTLVSSRFVKVSDIMSYERVGLVTVKGKTVSNMSLNIPVRGRFYFVSAMRFDGGKADEDPDIRSFIESFRFLNPPARVLTQSADLNQSAAYRTGYFAGQMLMFAVVIVGIILLIRVIAKPKQRSGPPRNPPPLPK